MGVPGYMGAERIAGGRREQYCRRPRAAHREPTEPYLRQCPQPGVGGGGRCLGNGLPLRSRHQHAVARRLHEDRHASRARPHRSGAECGGRPLLVDSRHRGTRVPSSLCGLPRRPEHGADVPRGSAARAAGPLRLQRGAAQRDAHSSGSRRRRTGQNGPTWRHPADDKRATAGCGACCRATRRSARGCRLRWRWTRS